MGKIVGKSESEVVNPVMAKGQGDNRGTVIKSLRILGPIKSILGFMS
jgi:hypothetical protein